MKSEKTREAGILMPISALPSKYGIGCMSREAYDFVDFLAEAGQSVWQILPMGHTGYGDSPYQAFSSFAGNPLSVSLDGFIRDGLLSAGECEVAELEGDDGRVDYRRQYENRYPLLRLAYARSRSRGTAADMGLLRSEGAWLDDYALFMAIKDRLSGKPLSEWDEPLRNRDAGAIARASEELSADIGFWKFMQARFFSEWRSLRSYANSRGIRIIGDIPIYVSPDSADVWCHPELFLLDAGGKPISVAGCPPDAFSPDGQLWGNPLYRWDEHKRQGYAWWRARISFALGMYDGLRIDHFRGFDAYYSIPYGHTTAREGEWRDGPSLALFEALEDIIGDREIIAEDLGHMTESARALVRACGFDGMKILQFGFDDEEGTLDVNPHLPHRYPEGCVAYTGTHDNPTLAEWFSELSEEKRRQVCGYANASEESIIPALIDCLMGSRAHLCIVPMQDYLALGAEARMNRPSTVGENWRWRLGADELGITLRSRIRKAAYHSERA